jgi:hypothetical protein
LPFPKFSVDLAGDFFTAWRELLERDLTMDHHSIEPGNDSRLIDEVMDGIEPGQSDDNEIDRDDDIEKPRHDQDQNAGDERHKRGDMGGGDNHRISCRFCCAEMVKASQSDAARRHLAVTHKPPFGSMRQTPPIPADQA